MVEELANFREVIEGEDEFALDRSKVLFQFHEI